MSQVTPETTKIGERQYTMYMLPPMASHDLLVDLLRMVGPAVGPVLDALVKGKSASAILEAEVGSEFFTKATSALFGSLDKTTLNKIIAAFRPITTVDGILLDKTFDAVYTGRLDEMYQWVVWGVRVQWGKSFSALVKGLAAQGATMATASPSPLG